MRRPRSRNSSSVMSHSPSHLMAGRASLGGWRGVVDGDRLLHRLKGFVHLEDGVGRALGAARDVTGDVDDGQEILVVDAAVLDGAFDPHQLAQRHRGPGRVASGSRNRHSRSASRARWLRGYVDHQVDRSPAHAGRAVARPTRRPARRGAYAPPFRPGFRAARTSPCPRPRAPWGAEIPRTSPRRRPRACWRRAFASSRPDAGASLRPVRKPRRPAPAEPAARAAPRRPPPGRRGERRWPRRSVGCGARRRGSARTACPWAAGSPAPPPRSGPRRRS